jgi:hypothetical protein
MDRMLIGFVILILVFVFDRNTLRIEFDKVAKFLGFMACVVVFQLAIGSFNGKVNIPDHAWMPTWRLGLVFWEDMTYAVSLYYLAKFLKLEEGNKLKKALWVIAAIAVSIDFGLGHIYQGLTAVFITALYPVFISLKYGRVVGWGTVCLCHIIYDFIVTAVIRYGHYMY